MMPELEHEAEAPQLAAMLTRIPVTQPSPPPPTLEVVKKVVPMVTTVIKKVDVMAKATDDDIGEVDSVRKENVDNGGR